LAHAAAKYALFLEAEELGWVDPEDVFLGKLKEEMADVVAAMAAVQEKRGIDPIDYEERAKAKYELLMSWGFCDNDTVE
jgi:hypothetical protein